MKRLGSFFQKCIAYLSAALLGLVFILTIFFPDMVPSIPKKFLLPNGILLLVAFGGWAFFVIVFQNITGGKLCVSLSGRRALNPAQIDRAVGWSCVLLFFLQLYITFNIFFVTAWDAGTIWGTALFRTEGSPLNEAYFSRYPNNLLLLLLETFLAKVHYMFGFLPEEYAPMACIAADCAAITLACYFTYRELCLLTDRRYAVIGFLLCVVLAGLSPWMCIFYSDSFGILFPILTIYLYSKPWKKEWSKFCGKAAAICVGCIGYYMKPQCIIPVIGILCVELICALMRRSARNGRNLLVLLITALLALNLVGNLITWKYESIGVYLDGEERFGAAHFFMMGLNEKTQGVYDEDDVQFSGSFATAKDRNRADMAVAMDRIRQMGPNGYFRQLVKKLLRGYSDGTFSWGGEGHFYPSIREEVNRWMGPRLRELFYSYGSKYRFLALAEQTAWIGVLLFAGAFELLSIKKGNHPGADVMKLTVLGAMLFMMLFETRARYTFLNVPIFCALAAQGMASLEAFFAGRKRTKKAS